MVGHDAMACSPSQTRWKPCKAMRKKKRGFIMAEANQQPAGLPEEPVRVNHTVRNIIIAVVVVALVAVGAFFGVRAFKDPTRPQKREPRPTRRRSVWWAPPIRSGWNSRSRPKSRTCTSISFDFQDYTSENPAVDSGELDLNEFQHLLYLPTTMCRTTRICSRSAARQSTRSVCIPPSTRASTRFLKAAPSQFRTTRPIRPVPSACSRLQAW